MHSEVIHEARLTAWRRQWGFEDAKEMVVNAAHSPLPSFSATWDSRRRTRRWITCDIKPILKLCCYACHGALKQESGLRVDTGQALRQGGDSGPAVISGKVEASPLIARVTAMEPDQRMPPEGEPLTAMQILALRQWISQGAVSLENEQPETDPHDTGHFSSRDARRFRPDLS